MELIRSQQAKGSHSVIDLEIHKSYKEKESTHQLCKGKGMACDQVSVFLTFVSDHARKDLESLLNSS